VLKEHSSIHKKRLPPNSNHKFIMSEEETENGTGRLYWSIGKVATEKMESLLSKMSDDTATKEDRLHAAILQEITALAKKPPLRGGERNRIRKRERCMG